ncbi:hypothetical protein [Streptomyces niveus]|uniref:hypothetical protein n=1 Tax=Streptomyces niveus TaxID=193462 RepID=UPI0003C5A9B7|nr:hypothetical protein [Streptomyces niveus]EST22789.1 hypothetical protein M877_28850 [Streptomyces niveus NCIMB 11891]
MKRKFANAARRLSGREADGWLGKGSEAVWQRLTDRITAWVHAGRRTDLNGWQAGLGSLFRLAAVVAAAYGAWLVVRRWPWLLWLIGLGWLVAAWRATHERPDRDGDDTAGEALTEDEPEPLDDDPAELPVEAVRALLFECLGDRPAVHLSTVLAHLQKKGHADGWKVADLRVRLEALGIPVHPKVKVGGVPTRGVRRVDLEPPTPADAAGTSPNASTAA